MQWFKNLFHKDHSDEGEQAAVPAPEPVLSLESEPASEPVVSLEPTPAPEPAPEKRTSDEIILEMAQSQVDKAAAAATEAITREQAEEEPDETYDIDDILYTDDGETLAEEDTDPEHIGF